MALDIIQNILFNIILSIKKKTLSLTLLILK